MYFREFSPYVSRKKLSLCKPFIVSNRFFVWSRAPTGCMYQLHEETLK